MTNDFTLTTLSVLKADIAYQSIMKKNHFSMTDIEDKKLTSPV